MSLRDAIADALWDVRDEAIDFHIYRFDVSMAADMVERAVRAYVESLEDERVAAMGITGRGKESLRRRLRQSDAVLFADNAPEGTT